VIAQRFYIVSIIYVHNLFRILARPTLQGVLVKWGSSIIYVHTLCRILTLPTLQSVLVKWGPIFIVNGLYQKAVQEMTMKYQGEKGR
jgi:hypothetical protein